MTNMCIVPLFVRESRELYADFKRKKSAKSYRPVNMEDTDDEWTDGVWRQIQIRFFL